MTCRLSSVRCLSRGLERCSSRPARLSSSRRSLMPRTRASEAAVEQRRQEILEYVIEHREVRIDDLTERFGVSLMTMHRDLDDLHERKLLRKLRGKVEAFPALTMETATRFRDG